MKSLKLLYVLSVTACLVYLHPASAQKLEWAKSYTYTPFSDHTNSLISYSDGGLFLTSPKIGQWGWYIIKTDQYGDTLFQVTADSVQSLYPVTIDTSSRNFFAIEFNNFNTDHLISYRATIPFNGGKPVYSHRYIPIDTFVNIPWQNIISLPGKGYILNGSLNSKYIVLCIDTKGKRKWYFENNDSIASFYLASKIIRTSNGYISLLTKGNAGIALFSIDSSGKLLKKKSYDPLHFTFTNSNNLIERDREFYLAGNHEQATKKVIDTSKGDSAIITYPSVLRFNANLDTISWHDIHWNDDSVPKNRKAPYLSSILGFDVMKNKSTALCWTYDNDNSGKKNYVTIIDSNGKSSFIQRLDNIGGNAYHYYMNSIAVAANNDLAIGGNADGYPVIMRFSTPYSGIVDPMQTDKGKFLLYPNPASSLLNIENRGPVALQSIMVMDIQGRTLKAFQFLETWKASQELDISNLAKGMYLLRLQTKEGIEVKRFVKE